MPKVPQYDSKPLIKTYLTKDGVITASQEAMIMTLCMRRKIQTPDMSKMTSRQASEYIDILKNPR